MRIAVIADPYIPVPPVTYGGIERVVAMLIESYEAAGHTVTLFAHPDSKVRCKLVPYGAPPHRGRIVRMCEIIQIWEKLITRKKGFDVIHNFGRLAGLMPLYFSRIPKIQSYQRAITPANVLVASALARRSIFFTACSDNCRKYGKLPGNWTTIYNGVSLDNYCYRETVSPDAPLIFLGRIEKIKGAHTAIDVARKAGRRLIIAGNHSSLPHDAYYWNHKILPHIGKDGIEYIGPVNDHQKNQLLGSSAALLMPVEWDEPFGIVMVEALACGTPVIAFKRGAVPEVIQDAYNGFVCDSSEEMVSKVKSIGSINRLECRRTVEARFSRQVITREYLSLYYRAIQGSN